MRPGAHIKAAVEVLEEVLERHRPAAVALADWGKSHRFAGSGDRAAIGNLVYDALRRRRSLAAQMERDTPRAIALGRRAARRWDYRAAAVAASADGSPHALEPLSEAERAGLSRHGASRCAGLGARRLSRTGWSPPSRAPSARRPPRKARRWRGARLSTCASTR